MHQYPLKHIPIPKIFRWMPDWAIFPSSPLLILSIPRLVQQWEWIVWIEVITVGYINIKHVEAHWQSLCGGPPCWGQGRVMWAFPAGGAVERSVSPPPAGKSFILVFMSILGLSVIYKNELHDKTHIPPIYIIAEASVMDKTNPAWDIGYRDYRICVRNGLYVAKQFEVNRKNQNVWSDTAAWNIWVWPVGINEPRLGGTLTHQVLN